MPGPLALIILDGWGIRAERDQNAVALAEPATFQDLLARYPSGTLEASGEAVGLPAGQMGNSEVGHTNLGAGRVVYQDLTRIDKSIREHDLETRPALLAAYDRCAGASTHALHLIGLLSDGGVHSHQEHLHALIRLAKARGVSRVFVHVLTDGRDTSPNGGRAYVAALEAALAAAGVGAHRLDLGPLLGDGSRQAVGADQARLRHDRPRRRADGAVGRRGHRSGLRRAGHRRVHQAARHRRRRRQRPSARCATATRSCSSTSAPIACGRSCGRWRSTTSTASIARAAAPGRTSR